MHPILMGNMNPDGMHFFKSGVIGLLVMIVYKNKTYKKNYIDENINPTSTFTKQNETKILYSQYCNEKWNIRIHNNGKQSLLILKSKKAV